MAKFNEKVKEISIKKSLRYSIFEATFNSIKVGFGESFFSAFAVFLKANNIQLGLLGTLPQALGSLLQLFSDRIINFFHSRKKVVYLSALLESLMHIPIALVFFFGTFKIYHLLFFASLYWIFGMILSPAWNSWIGDLVDNKETGSYFGKRNKIAGLASFFALLIAGYILQRFTNGTLTQYIGFTIIFAIALTSRIASFIFLTKQYEPEYNPPPNPHFTFMEFIKQARFRNYGLFVFYLCSMNFAVYLAGPFFVPYMLKDLKFSYMTFTIINAVAIIAKYLSMPIWGNASDKFGPKKVLALSGFLMPVLPLLWLFSKSFLYIVIIQIYSGFVWAGFEISSFTFIFDTTTKEKRATCIAYYNVLNGIIIIISALIGGLIVRYNHLFWSKYLLIFLISFILRYLASLIFIPKLKEVREVEHVSYHKLLLNIIAIMPTKGLIYDLITFRRNNRQK